MNDQHDCRTKTHILNRIGDYKIETEKATKHSLNTDRRNHTDGKKSTKH